MTIKQTIKHGNRYPFDASDEWWEGDGDKPPKPASKYHAVARAVIADLQDRRGIKHELDNIDEETRVEIIDTLANIIRVRVEDA